VTEETVEVLIVWLQLLTPFIAAALIAYFGVRGYGSQKREDRKEKLHDEKRAIYRDVLTSLSDAASDVVRRQQSPRRQQANIGVIDAALSTAVFTNMSVMKLYASDVLCDLVQSTFDGIVSGDQSMPSLKELASAMGKDLQK
jgi:hypothetical protein